MASLVREDNATDQSRDKRAVNRGRCVIVCVREREMKKVEAKNKLEGLRQGLAFMPILVLYIRAISMCMIYYILYVNL